jgi:hypothetical protein
VRLLFLSAIGLLAAVTTVEGQRRFRPDSISYDASGAGYGQLRGVEARIQSDGDGGEFSANGTVWNVTCGEEENTGHRGCSLTQRWRLTAFTVSNRADGAVFVRVGEERSTYLGTDVQLRVDSGPTYTVREPGWNAARSAEIVGAMRKGRSVMTSFIQWPSSDYIDAFLDLAGFDVAMEYMEFAVQ